VLFSWRKTQKTQKKTWCSDKSFTSYLHNRSTLQHNSNRFWKLQSRSITLVFFNILGNWSCDHPPTTHQVNPDRQNHLYLVFLHILVKLHQISFLGYMQRTLKAVPHSVYTVYAIFIFPHFLLETPPFLFWTSTLDPDNSTKPY
jgi:hypothetical protein